MNSPLATAAVGTSTDEPPPSTARAPTSTTMTATPAAAAMSRRLLARHMPLHHCAGFQPGLDDHLVVVHRAERHVAQTAARAVHDPDRACAVLECHRVARHDDHVVFPFELDVDSRGQVWHELRVAALDTDNRHEIPD